MSGTDSVEFRNCACGQPLPSRGATRCPQCRAAHARGEKPNYDLWMMMPEAGKLTRITFDAEFDGLPVFSPDGKRLMWTSKRGGLSEAQVFIADFTLPKEFN